jgi:hypothetical protein
MKDVALEIIRSAVIGCVVLFLILISDHQSTIRQTSGWKYIVSGFWVVFFGSLIDITDNFDSLNRYIFIGDTKYQAFIEKIVGSLLGFILIAVGFWKWLPQIIQNEKIAMEEINQLRGILPICAHCKKIRDDAGYWRKIEEYIESHSKAEFSHSICKECIDKYFPELDL